MICSGELNSPVKTDSELRKVDFEVEFKLMRRAVIQGGVSAVKVEVGIEVVGHLQSRFYAVGKRAAIRQQFGGYLGVRVPVHYAPGADM